MLQRGLLKEYSVVLSWVARIADAFLLLIAGVLAHYCQFGNLHLTFFYQVAFLLSFLLVFPVFSTLHIYNSLRGRSLIAHLIRVSVAVVVLMLILAAVTFITKTGVIYSRSWYLMWVLLTIGLLTIFRIALYSILRLMRKKGWNQRQILIIGSNNMIKELSVRIKSSLWTGFSITKTLNEKTLPDDLDVYIEKQRISEVWIALPISAEKTVKDIMHALRYCVVSVRYFPDTFGIELLNNPTTDILGLPAVNLISSPMIGINRIIKVIEDMILSFLILVMISPLMLIIAVLIKLTSKGPALYKQMRHGWDGKPILIYKFRSMVEHAEKNGLVTQAKKEDPRITKIGKFLRKTSLDELPQFINVLQGKMSIVGPRPHAIEHNEFYKELIPAYMQRHHVKPGISGWAQINGWRGETDTLEKMQKRIEYDLYYIEHWSLWFDLRIIFLTVFKGFVNKNAY